MRADNRNKVQSNLAAGDITLTIRKSDGGFLFPISLRPVRAHRPWARLVRTGHKRRHHNGHIGYREMNMIL